MSDKTVVGLLAAALDFGPQETPVSGITKRCMRNY